MTALGKIFVLVNLAISLVMATLAFGVYANGIDWSENPAKGNQPAGRGVAKKAEIADLSKGISLSYETWKTANTELLTREEQRRFDRRWYAQELEKLYVGKGQVVMVAQEKGAADAAGRPTLVAAVEDTVQNVPLQAMGVYLNKLDQIRAENNRIRTQLDAKVKEDTDLTNQLTGDPERKTKGIRLQLAEERKKQEGLIAEAGIEEGLRINREVESELILKRLSSINERIRELETFLKMQKEGGGKQIEKKGDEKKIEKSGADGR